MAPPMTSQTKESDLLPDIELFDTSAPTLTPETDISSDSETPIKTRGPSKARAKKARKALQQSLSKSQSRNSLRCAKDILSRIRHDPALDRDNFIIGYQDRHSDVMEMPVAMWKGGGDVTDEEFIPQHRILYFRRKGDGVRVWDRKKRVDLLFGTGDGSADGQEEGHREEASAEFGMEDDKSDFSDAGSKFDHGKPLNKTAKDERTQAEYESAVLSMLT